ncbi:MAG TPA: hypothetical protein VGD61_06110 [Pyrinomonadaceae bacterium]
MNPAFRVLLVLIAVVTTAQHAAAEEWHGIKPGHSTRADVVRVFGECSDQGTPCRFVFENEDISIDFSTAANCHSARLDTVLLIKRALRNVMAMKTLGFDKRRFKSFDPSDWRNQGYRAFVNEKSGLLFKTIRGDVFEIYYIPPNTEWQQVCTNYYGNNRELLRISWPHVFVVNSVSCPTDTVIDGTKVPIEAGYVDYGQFFTLTWMTTGGKIVAGQGTKKITLDTTGLAGKIITVTVELNDGNQHTANGSCSLTIRN